MYLFWLIPLCIVGGVVVLVLLMPLRLQLSGEVGEEVLEGCLVGHWAWGVVGFRWRPGEGAKLTLLGIVVHRFIGGEEKKEKRKPKKEKKEKKKWIKGEWALENREVLLRDGRRVLQALHLRARVSGVVGTGDPAEGAVLEQIFSRLPNLTGDLQVEYLEDVLDLDGEASVSVWPVEVAVLVIALFLRIKMQRVFRAAWLRRKKDGSY